MSLRDNHLKLVGTVFCGILGLAGMLVYLASIAYLVIRKNKEGTHLLALTTSESLGTANVSGDSVVYCLPREDIINMQLPQRSIVSDLD